MTCGPRARPEAPEERADHDVPVLFIIESIIEIRNRCISEHLTSHSAYNSQTTTPGLSLSSSRHKLSYEPMKSYAQSKLALEGKGYGSCLCSIQVPITVTVLYVTTPRSPPSCPAHPCASRPGILHPASRTPTPTAVTV